MKLLYVCIVTALHLLPPQLTRAAGSHNFGNTYWHDLLESQPNSVTGAHRRTSRRTQQQQQEMPSQQGLMQSGLYPPEGYYQQDSERFSEYQQDFSGQMSHFGSETADDARRAAYEGERGVADDDLSSAHSMTQERRRRKARARELQQLRRQQMSEVGGGDGEENFDDAASQLSLAHLSLHGQVGSGTDASALNTQQYSSSAQSDFDLSGSSTSRVSRRKSKAAAGPSEPQTARLASRRDQVQMAPPAAGFPQDHNAIQEKINDPRFVQLFQRAWLRRGLDFHLQPGQVAAEVIKIGHELRSPAAVEMLALHKINTEAPVDQRDFRGNYGTWMTYYKQMEARGAPIAFVPQQQARRGVGGSSGQQQAGGSGGGGGGLQDDEEEEEDDESAQMVPDYAPLSNSDRKNIKEAYAVFSVFMTNYIWTETPHMDPNNVPIESIENLSWGMKVGDFDKDKTESLIRFYLERGLGKSEEELAHFDSLRYATRKAWKAKVRAMKEERIANAMRRPRRS